MTKYRDSAMVMEDMLNELQIHDSLTITQLIGVSMTSYKIGRTYLDRLLRKNYIEDAPNNGHTRISTAKAYKITDKGKSILIFLREWNS